MDALRDPGFRPVASENGSIPYFIEPTYELQAGEQLRFREAASYVETALAGRGYYRTIERERADLLLRMDASISEPISETQSYSEPVYVRRWGYSHVVRVPVRNEQGAVVGFTHSRIYEPPRNEFAGWTDRVRQTTVYEKSLSLTAYAFDDERNRGAERWTLNVSAIDQTSDLRSYLPLLVAAGMPYIGEQTQGQVIVRMRDDDEKIAFIRRGS